MERSRSLPVPVARQPVVLDVAPPSDEDEVTNAKRLLLEFGNRPKGPGIVHRYPLMSVGACVASGIVLARVSGVRIAVRMAGYLILRKVGRDLVRTINQRF